MAQDEVIMRAVERGSDPAVTRTDVLLTAAEYAALEQELESLRTKHRSELEERLRLAREFGGAAENDDVLAVLEDAAVDEVRIGQLEDLLRSASIVEAGAAGNGIAGLGSIVRVADEAGRTTEYRLVGRRSPDSGRREVSPSSPVGKGLLGAREGDLVVVGLPGGRDRTLRVLEVVPPYGSVAEAA